MSHGLHRAGPRTMAGSHGLRRAGPRAMAASRRVRLLAGVAVGAAYVTVAVLAGRGSMLLRRPVLDGLAPPPAYRWVKPPPDLASSNQSPASGRFTVGFDPTRGSRAGVFSTSDTQASVALPTGAVPARPGATSASLTITPLDGGRFGQPASSLVFEGNVYRYDLRYQPGGAPVGTLTQPAQVVLFFPAPPNALTYHHTMVTSSDGRTWRRVATTVSPVQQLTQVNVRTLGYFAVARSTSGRPRSAAQRWADRVPLIVVSLVAAALLVLIGRREWRERRSGRGASSAKDPPPRDQPRKDRSSRDQAQKGRSGRGSSGKGRPRGGPPPRNRREREDGR